MLPVSYHRSSSTGVELEPLTNNLSAPPSPQSQSSQVVINGGDTTVTTKEIEPPSNFQCIRDLLVSVCFFMLGWWGPKLTKPSQAYLLEREIPYQVLNSTNEVILDLELNNPLVQPPTVPSSPLIFGSIWVPIIIMALVTLLSPRRSYHEALIGISSLLLGVGGSEGSTQLLKHWVLRHRPNFYALCGFNMATRKCEAIYPEVLEAQVSFPSGHSSLSWCGMVVLVLFLLNRRHGGGKLYFFVCAVLPFSWAAFVASSRIVDHWHHVSDVLTGVFLGCLWGIIGYHVHHSAPKNGGKGSSPSTAALPPVSSYLAIPIAAPRRPSTND